MSTEARVLVVDADPAAIAAISHPLQHEGYFVASAFDADGALRVARRLGPFELLITALRLAPVNGVELARALREREPELQVLYITSSSDAWFAPSVPHTVDDDVLETPFSEHELLDAVAALLYWHRRPGSSISRSDR
jgi:CheY-like chemotaxis protein